MSGIRTGFTASRVLRDGSLMTIETESLSTVKRFFKKSTKGELRTLEVRAEMANDEVMKYLKGAKG